MCVSVVSQLERRYLDSVKLNRTWVEGVDIDDDPPIIPSTGGGRFGAQITSNTYDVCGRRYQLTFTCDP
jgi:hypothetical protein